MNHILSSFQHINLFVTCSQDTFNNEDDITYACLTSSHSAIVHCVVISLAGCQQSANGLVNIWSLQDGSLLQTVVGGGGVAHLCWAGPAGLSVCFTQSQVNAPSVYSDRCE